MASNENSCSDTSGATLTLRLIRSFEFRNWKPAVIHNVDLNCTTENLKDTANSYLLTSKLPPPFKNFTYDCLKIEYQPFGLKTNDPLINTEDDDKLMLKPGLTLAEQGIQNETEISYFRQSDYLSYVESKTKKRDGDDKEEAQLK